MIRKYTQALSRYAKYRVGLLKFKAFERKINPATVGLHDEIAAWATAEAEKGDDTLLGPGEFSADPVVKQAVNAIRKIEKEFRMKHQTIDAVRVLAHLPSLEISPAGYSLVNNLIRSLNYIGIRSETFENERGLADSLRTFKPTVLIIGDYAPFLQTVNWDLVASFKKTQRLLVGLTASLEEYGNTPLRQRLAWAKKHEVDFYYSYRSPEYIKLRPQYRAFEEEGYKILCIEFGVNPLLYYPVPGIQRDLDFVFLASSNQDKWDRYISYFGDIFAHYPGYISGPGWAFSRSFTFLAERDRYLYARAKVGLNLHITEQIEWACELNERTYMLAACGVPQLIDNPALLPQRFSPEGFFIAGTPREYRELFRELVSGSVEVEKAVLLSQREVLENYTTFHRAEGFALALNEMLQNPS